jgi:peptidoglycan/LPS O-acetylase OafA/YrhL
MARVSLALPLDQSNVRLSPKAGFNQNMHGARGALAMMVFCFHIACSGLPGFHFLQAAGRPVMPLLCLQFGVEIFFCISGTIVIGALERAGSPGRFLWDRAIRILPVLWATLAVIVPLGFVTHQSNVAHYTAREIAWIVPSNMLALPGVLALPLLHLGAWSLSYEMTFYFVAVFMWWVAPRNTALKFLVCALAIALIAWQPRAIFFAVGVLVARTDLSNHPVLGRAIRWPLAWLLVFAALWYVVTQAGADGGAGSLLLWLRDGRIGLAALAVSAAILGWAGIVGGHGIICGVLRTAPAQWLGSLSYSFYLWHLLVLALLKRLMAHSGMVDHLGVWSQLGLFAVGLPASLLVAQASASLIERRLTGRLKHWRPDFGEMLAFFPAAHRIRLITLEKTASLAA